MIKQYRLDRIERYVIETRRRIEKGKRNITERQIPTIIMPQASRYQDLLRYSTRVMSDFN